MNNNTDMPWRPAYESYSAAGWIIAMLFLVIAAVAADLPNGPFWYMSLVAILFFAWNFKDAWHIWSAKFALCGIGIEFMQLAILQKRAHDYPDRIWLGYGFDWKSEHTQRIYDLKRIDPEKFLPPHLFLRVKEKITGKTIASLDKNSIGAGWIHGVEPNEKDVDIFIENLIGNTLIAGTTRCGKTILLSLLLSQFIFRKKSSVLCFDPKGDLTLRENMRRAAILAGRTFHSFHLGFPTTSICIDPLKNYINLSELASRVASLVPSDSGAGDAFTAFAWDVSNAIFLGLVESGQKPTLLKLRQYVGSGVEPLLAISLPTFFEKMTEQVPDWEKKANEYISRARKKVDGEFKTILPTPREVLTGHLYMYEAVYKPKGLRSEGIEALSSIHKHDVTHYGKMLANFKPVLAMLTTGEFGTLLSPDGVNIDDERLPTDLKSLIDSNSVVYIGLNSLADKVVASAVGSVLLSDLTAVAAARQNFRTAEENKANPCYVIVDEAAQVVNDPYIQLLNMSGSAGFVNIAATQTISDFAARLGNEDKSRVMLGNFNNLIALRSKDRTTQDFITETFGEGYVKSTQVSKGTSSSTEQNITHFSGTIGERVSEMLEEKFPTELLGQMPNWQFIASLSGGRLTKGRFPITLGED